MAEPQNGRIGGGVLKDNLERNGVDLSFASTSNEIANNRPLLFLDVNNQKIGVNLDNPAGALGVDNIIATTELTSTFANVDFISIDTNQIVSNFGSLNLNALDQISVTILHTDNIEMKDNTINTLNNENLELRPDGIGNVQIGTPGGVINERDLNVTGSIHATGDITFNANLTLGDSDADSVFFEAEVNSNLVPDQTDTRNLGSATKRFRNIYSNLLNGQRVNVGSVSVSDTSLALRQGNIFYVSTLGSDTNVGDHQHGAFRTLKHALSVIDASSQGPATIHIYPGVYEEEFPLIVPERVTISGEDIRNTIITPTLSTNTEDAFLLNQNCVIENITIKDFYSPGHAFSFAPGAVIVERSPYVRNVSVITQGSVTSSTDPRGFDAGDAGKGAIVDGAVVDSSTPTPSMLFHSVTFITPGVDAITMTNGVRVEWLNSFTYFANRGLYATQGTGRIGPDGSTLEYGAEIRSIGSANVYGNFGAVADGANTLLYLIGHNFAYIGTGKDVSNDKTLTLFDQETQELNQGRIYYTSTDAEGTFRIGNAFYVNFEDGTTSIDANQIDFSGISSIFIRSGLDFTYIDGEKIELGNFRISGNTISTRDGDFILFPSTGILNIDSNPNFIIPRGTNNQRTSIESDIRYSTTNNLFEGFSTGNLSFGGIYSDDRQTYITANNQEGDIVFGANGIETGRLSGNYINLEDSSDGQFGNFELNGLSTDNILIDNNTISTYNTNADLELLPNGASQVKLDQLYVYSSVIENFENTNFSIFVTDRGYVKFDTTKGVVIPYGSTSERTSVPDTGDTRYNSTEQYLEVWNGEAWQRAAGEGEEVTEEVLKELVDIYTLVLG